MKQQQYMRQWSVLVAIILTMSRCHSTTVVEVVPPTQWTSGVFCLAHVHVLNFNTRVRISHLIGYIL